MDILSAEIENFGSIEEAYINLSNKGLVNIEGENLDDPSANSNGSGKSTIPDAIRWCLYGTTARGLKGDDVISDFAKKCCVTVVVKDGDDTYMIQRWRKDKSKPKASGVALFRNGTGGELIDLTQGTDTLTQEKIVAVIGSSEEVFTKSVYAGQEALPDLPNMTDKEIKLLVEEASGVELLSKAYTIAQEHDRNVKRELREARAEYETAETSLARSKSDHEAAGVRFLQWGEGRDSAVRAAEGRYKEADDRVTAKAKEVAALPPEDALNAMIDKLEGRIKSVSSERERENELMREVTKATSAANVARSTLSAELSRAKIDKAALDNVASQVGSPCKSCGKPHTEADLAEVTARAKEQSEKATKKAVEAHAEAERAIAAQKEAEAVLEAHKASMTDLTDATTKLRNTNAALSKVRAAKSELVSLKKVRETEAERLEAVKAETNPHDKALEAAVARVAEDEKTVKGKMQRVQKCEAASVASDKAIMVLGPRGVRAHVLDTVTPFLNDRTAHYLGTLSDGMIDATWTTLSTTAKGDLTEKFSIEVSRAAGGKSFKALSGGQKRKVRLACALALQDLVASRATKPIRLLMLDEVDDALDDSGLERLMTILEEKGREKGTVLIISHNSMKDWCRQTATVTMEKGRSSISGVLSE